MNHEPECLLSDHSTCDELLHKLSWDDVACIVFQAPCICESLRAAYRRGREDAVQSVGMALIGRYGDPVNSALHEAVSAAARGDGEQA